MASDLTKTPHPDTEEVAFLDGRKRRAANGSITSSKASSKPSIPSAVAKSDHGEAAATDDDKKKDVGLKKEITLMNSCGIIIGSIIGSGIFVSPTGVLRNMGSVGASLVIWVACGVFSLFGALCYAELGTMIHRSGADYAYVMVALGPFLAFLRMWVEVIVVRPVSMTIIALTFAKYALEPIFPGCEQPQAAVRLLAAICILFLTFVNCISVRLSTFVQDFLSFAKLTVLVLIIITGFVQIGRGQIDSFQDAFEDSTYGLGNICNAFYSGLFAYSGWNYLNCMIEEMKNPNRDLPVAICISLAVVTSVYTMVNVAYFTTVTPGEILITPAVAVTFGIRLYGVVWFIIPIGVALSTFGGANGVLLTTSRIFFVAAEEKQMPSILSTVQYERSTPVAAVLFTSIISLIYILYSDIYSLMNYLGFVQFSAIAICIGILLYFRWKKDPTMKASIRVPLPIPIIYLAGTAFLTIFAFVGSPNEALMGCFIICTGIPIYWVFISWKRKPHSITRRINWLTETVQKILLVLPTDKGS